MGIKNWWSARVGAPMEILSRSFRSRSFADLPPRRRGGKSAKERLLKDRERISIGAPTLADHQFFIPIARQLRKVEVDSSILCAFLYSLSHFPPVFGVAFGL